MLKPLVKCLLGLRLELWLGLVHDLAFCVTLHKVFLKCELFNIGHFDYLQHTDTHTHTQLLASFPIEVGPERTVQAGMED